MGNQVALAARYYGLLAQRSSNVDVSWTDLFIARYTTTDARGESTI